MTCRLLIVKKGRPSRRDTTKALSVPWNLGSTTTEFNRAKIRKIASASMYVLYNELMFFGRALAALLVWCGDRLVRSFIRR